jgi:hypothetical protein
VLYQTGCGLSPSLIRKRKGQVTIPRNMCVGNSGTRNRSFAGRYRCMDCLNKVGSRFVDGEFGRGQSIGVHASLVLLSYGPFACFIFLVIPLSSVFCAHKTFPLVMLCFSNGGVGWQAAVEHGPQVQRSSAVFAVSRDA